MVFLSMVKHSGDSLDLGRKVINQMKIKCVKAECPICKITGSIQLFINKQNEVRYARTRHYSHLDKDSKKPQFTYCKIEDLEALKTLLNGQLCQDKPSNNIDQKLKDSNFNFLMEPRAGFDPATITLPR